MQVEPQPQQQQQQGEQEQPGDVQLQQSPQDSGEVLYDPEIHPVLPEAAASTGDTTFLAALESVLGQGEKRDSESAGTKSPTNSEEYQAEFMGYTGQEFRENREVRRQVRQLTGKWHTQAKLAEMNARFAEVDTPQDAESPGSSAEESTPSPRTSPVP
jgi:hypothetical protein